MSEVSVDSSSISSAIKLCQEAQNQLRMTTLSIRKQVDGIRSNWNDKKCDEFVQIIEKCFSSLIKPIEGLENCENYLRQIHNILYEYDSVHFISNGDNNMGSLSSIVNRTNTSQCNGSNEPVSSTCGTPHFFDSTQEGWQHGIGSDTYDSPRETGERLNSNQGVPQSQGGEGVEGYRGTCGLVSCQNVLRMAGLTISEADVVNYARNTRTGFLGTRRLCTINSTPNNNGGTYVQDRQAILRHFGVDSSIENGTIDNIARYVADGRGVIAAVEANSFWGTASNQQEGHAIVITSVERDSMSGSPIGFYVCDSGTGEHSRYVTTSELQDSLFGSINVTSRIIR